MEVFVVSSKNYGIGGTFTTRDHAMQSLKTIHPPLLRSSFTADTDDKWIFHCPITGNVYHLERQVVHQESIQM